MTRTTSRAPAARQPSPETPSGPALASRRRPAAPDHSPDRVVLPTDASHIPVHSAEQLVPSVSYGVPSPTLQRCGGTECPPGGCNHDGELTVQRQAASLVPGPAATRVPSAVHEVVRSPGRELPSTVHWLMEPRFGHDFGNVRVHTDAMAAGTARAVGAHAYTVGRDVIFGDGQFRPDSIAGRRLIAHELTHVIQQRAAGGPLAARPSTVSSPSDAAEREADRVANAVTTGTLMPRGQENPLEPSPLPLGPERAPTPESGPTPRLGPTLVAEDRTAKGEDDGCGLSARTTNVLAYPIARLARPVLQRACSCGGTPDLIAECDKCRTTRLGLQRFAVGHSPDAAPPIVHDVLRSSGHPLEPGTRTFFESRLGFDLSQVRVHTDDRAAMSARAVSALAYTVGRSIVFDRGRYAPHQDEGRRLLAHELVHTIQQGRTRPPSRGERLSVDPSDTDPEGEARKIAAMPSRPAVVDHAAAGGKLRVQRLDVPPQPDPEVEKVVEEALRIIARGVVKVGPEVVPEADAVAATAGTAAGGAGIGLLAGAGVVVIGAIVILGVTYLAVKLYSEHKELDEYGGTLPPGGLPQPKPLTGPVVVGDVPLGDGTFKPQPQAGLQEPPQAEPEEPPQAEPEEPPQAEPEEPPRAEPRTRRHPNQTCEDDVLDRLQADVDWLCKHFPAAMESPGARRRPPKEARARTAALRGCDEKMSKAQLRRNAMRNEKCARARQKLQKQCFANGADPGHQEALKLALEAAERCWELYRRAVS